jgi:hypothetical protein
MRRLLAYAQDELADSEAESIRVHLEKCGACQWWFDQVQKVRSATAGKNLIEPPDWLLRQGMNLFQRFESEPSDSLAKRVLAFLVVDSFAQEPVLGVRSVTSMSRQMLYRAGDYDIDLSIDIKPSHVVAILGQSIPLNQDFTAVSDGDVQLLQGTRLISATKINELGEFTFDGIPEGIYDMKLQLKDEEIEIAELEAIARLSEKQVM